MKKNKLIALFILTFSLFAETSFARDLASDTENINNKLIPYRDSNQFEHFTSPKVVEGNKEQKKEDDPIIGSIRFLDLFECKNMIYKRGIFIWLPENYSRDNGPYSVIYFHDAQNLFLPSKSFSGYDWKVDETITRLMKEKKIKPCIVVGIPNSPARDNELNTATYDGKVYSDFVINEVMPFIKKRFPVSRHREDHIVAGSSMGGLMSFQMAYENPNRFGGAICMSSAFHRKLSNILNIVKENKKQPLNVKFYIDTGELEKDKEDGEDIYSLFFEMKKLMEDKGFTEDNNLKCYMHKGAQHNEKAWAQRLDRALLFLLKK